MNKAETVYRSAEINVEAGSDGKPSILEGRMVPYNVWTEIRSAVEGHFMERVMPGALTKTLTERVNRMRILYEHGLSRLLDKQPIAKFETIRDEADGPYFRSRLLPGLPDLLLEGLREGLYGLSIGMRFPISKVDTNYRPKRSDFNPEGIPESTIREVGLDEVSVTAFPVYEGTTAGVRSLTDHMTLEAHGQLLIAKLAREDPERLLTLVRSELEVEPLHSEPTEPQPEPEEQEPEEAPAPEPEPVKEEEPEGSRDTPPKPSKDWLSEQEARPSWKIP